MSDSAPSARAARLSAAVRQHWPLAAVLAVAAVLIFTNLGRDHLWSDEGDTAVLASSILKFGVPTAWDGVTFTDSSDLGKRVTDDFVMVSHPWLQYYLTAGSFALFGETAWAARLPFAILGLATIALVYVLVWRATSSRWAALTSALLLTLSVQFLLYSRQSRYYTLNAALTCLLFLQFGRLRTTTHAVGFAAIAILLFHSHPIGIVPVAVLGLLAFLSPPLRDRRRAILLAAPMVALFTVPWIYVARRGYSEATDVLADASRFLPRLGQFFVETTSVTSLLGALMLLLLARRRRARPDAPATPDVDARRRTARRAKAPAAASSPPFFSLDERTLVIMIVATVAAYGVAVAFTQSRDVLWTVGVRYTSAVLPFGAILAGLAIFKASGSNWKLWLALVAIFAFTKVARVTPWTFWQLPTAVREREAPVTFHQPPALVDRVLRTGQLQFLRSLMLDEPGTQSHITDFLAQHASPGDIVVTNYGWQPLYFHTRLPQGLTILPSYPIYPVARSKKLPEYVFTGEGVRWIVWRQAWGTYRGQDLARLLAFLDGARVPVTRVAEIPETMWENRENVHFRRFPDDEYIYPWYGELPDTLIFRVGP